MSVGLTFFCVLQIYLWGSPSSSALPSYISGGHLLLLLLFLLLLLLLFFFFCFPQLYLRGSPSSSSSSAYPSYISGFTFFSFVFFFVYSPAISLGFTIWVRFLRRSPFSNPNFQVVIFRLRGWCMQGVFLLLAFIRLGHGCQNLLSPCDGMHVYTQTKPRFVLSPESFGGTDSEPMLTPRGKSSLPE